MTESGILAAFVALCIVSFAGDVASALHRTADRVECAVEGATICLVDEAREG